MDLNARVDVNCGRKDGRTENWKPISHLAKAGATKNGHVYNQRAEESVSKQDFCRMLFVVCLQVVLTLLHSEILACLSAIGLKQS